MEIYEEREYKVKADENTSKETIILAFKGNVSADEEIVSLERMSLDGELMLRTRRHVLKDDKLD